MINFKLALRNLLKNKGLSFINVIGLAIGIACCILIFLYVSYEKSYDRWHSNADNICRVLTIDEALGVSSNLVGITMPALGPAMIENIPEVEEVVRMQRYGRNLISYGDKNLYSEDLHYAESTIFTVFDFNLLKGEKGEVLKRPYTAVVTESMAKRIFGNEDPMGKSFLIDNDTDNPLEVVGVMEDISQPSHLNMDIVASLVPSEQDSNLVQFLQSWRTIAMTTYIRLNDISHEKEVEAKMDTLIRANDVGENFSVTLQPLTEAHLASSGILYDGVNQHKGDLTYIKTLSIIAFLVILIASFNFMNLSTARSTKRAVEVGIRKVLGAVRPQLIRQFLIEAVVMVFISMILALFLVSFAGLLLDFPMGGDLALQMVLEPERLGILIGFTLVLGLLAGSYPAFMLSSFLPVKVLKGKFGSTNRGIWLRRILVVTQFAASIAMIIGTVIIYQQIGHLKNLDKGFDPEQVLNISLGDPQLIEHAEALQTEIQKDPHVLAVGTSSSMPGRGFGRRGIRPEGAAEDDVWIVSVLSVNESYMELMGMEVLQGRGFSEEFGTEGSRAVLINEAMAEALGWEDPINKNINRGGPNSEPFQVVGMVKDFHFANMRHKIEPIMMSYREGANNVLSVRLNTEGITETLAHIESAWQKVNPNHPYEYTFFDEEFAEQYESDERFGGLAMSFTWLAIFVACLGLFGLSAFTAEQRTKEISIRKIMGASTGSLIGLLSKEFALLVAIAAILAVPIAYFGMKDWLESFAYSIPLHWTVFALSGILAFAIALMTTSYHAIKTAQANPVESLRYE